MSVTEQTRTAIPAGTWVADPVHSRIAFAVKHNAVLTFEGSFGEFDVQLSDGRLEGTVEVASVVVDDEQLTGHLQTPDFFDTEQFPELRFASSRIERDGDRLSVAGELTIKGTTAPVEIAGTIAGPVTDAYGKERLGLELQTTVNRHDFGVSWNAELPGGAKMLADDVLLTAHLELVQS
jgi:polyisoprenoid-binding protein YceI